MRAAPVDVERFLSASGKVKDSKGKGYTVDYAAIPVSPPKRLSYTSPLAFVKAEGGEASHQQLDCLFENLVDSAQGPSASAEKEAAEIKARAEREAEEIKARADQEAEETKAYAKRLGYRDGEQIIYANGIAHAPNNQYCRCGYCY